MGVVMPFAPGVARTPRGAAAKGVRAFRGAQEALWPSWPWRSCCSSAASASSALRRSSASSPLRRARSCAGAGRGVPAARGAVGLTRRGAWRRGRPRACAARPGCRPGCGDVCVAEHLLDVADVRAAFEHHRRHRVPEDVAGAGLADPGAVNVAAHQIGQRPQAENARRQRSGTASRRRARSRAWGARLQVARAPRPRALTDRDHAVLCPCPGARARLALHVKLEDRQRSSSSARRMPVA